MYHILAWIFNILTLHIYHYKKVKYLDFLQIYICEEKSDIWLKSVRFQSDLGHFRYKNLTYLKDF